MQYSFCVADKADEAGPRIYVPESGDNLSILSIDDLKQPESKNNSDDRENTGKKIISSKFHY